MKILKGRLKGKNIVSPAKIRPVALRVRKACFDILGEEIIGKRILDLFSGSGSLGIEALSCGAAESMFLDIKKQSVTAVKKNLTALKLLGQGAVYCKDSLRGIGDFFIQREVFDIIFVDPPYYQGMVKRVLQTLEEYDIVAPLGYIVCFCSAKDLFTWESKKFPLLVSRKYGQTSLLIYQKQKEIGGYGRGVV